MDWQASARVAGAIGAFERLYLRAPAEPGQSEADAALAAARDLGLEVNHVTRDGTALPVMALWAEADGYRWDSAEDSGGFDRVSPVGPFATLGEALDDLGRVWRFGYRLQHGRPEHYPA